MKSRECLAFFGVEYQTYLWMIAISLIIGFGSYLIYSKIKKIEFETKLFLIKSLLLSLILFLLFSVLSILFQRTMIY